MIRVATSGVRGRDEALARAMRRRETALDGVRALAGTGLVAGMLALAGWRTGLVALVAALVVLVFAGVRALALVFEVRDRALARIGSAPPGAAVPEELTALCDELRDPVHRERLAHRLERAGDTPSVPGVRRPANRHAVAEAGPALASVAGALRDPQAETRGVAAAERLVCDAGSALYRPDPATLRQELRRIAFLLAER